jgi:hypothetical protein
LLFAGRLTSLHLWNSTATAGIGRADAPIYQAWTYGDYVLRDARSVDVPVIAALEWACQSHPWQLERVEAFLTVPHEGHDQFGLMASLERRPVGYAILAVGEGNGGRKASGFWLTTSYSTTRAYKPLTPSSKPSTRRRFGIESGHDHPTVTAGRILLMLAATSA